MTDAANEALFSKIDKLLEMARRGGTEAEAAVAMRKVHELLIKHNLSMADVTAARPSGDGCVKHYEPATQNQPWQGLIWAAIAELYFCGHFQSRKRNRDRGVSFSHVLIGKPANIAVVRKLAAYIVEAGERLAKESAARIRKEARRVFRVSFKKGFAVRIAERATAEIRRAKEGRTTDPETGTALLVIPLYDEAKNAVQKVIDEEQIKVEQSGSPEPPRSLSGFYAGVTAGDTVSLSPNLIEGGQPPVKS